MPFKRPSALPHDPEGTPNYQRSGSRSHRRCSCSAKQQELGSCRHPASPPKNLPAKSSSAFKGWSRRAAVICSTKWGAKGSATHKDTKSPQTRRCKAAEGQEASGIKGRASHFLIFLKENSAHHNYEKGTGVLPESCERLVTGEGAV